MTEEIFEQLGFEKVVVTIEESGHDNDFYYYTMDIGDICLMSNADDEAEKEGWYCSIFDSNTLKIRGEGDLKALVDILKLNS
jgi:hypothetical protein